MPNAGHKAVADLEKRLTDQGRNVTVVTQNIDRLHHKAGSQNIIEMHGMAAHVCIVHVQCKVNYLRGICFSVILGPDLYMYMYGIGKGFDTCIELVKG